VPLAFSSEAIEPLDSSSPGQREKTQNNLDGTESQAVSAIDPSHQIISKPDSLGEEKSIASVDYTPQSIERNTIRTISEQAFPESRPTTSSFSTYTRSKNKNKGGETFEVSPRKEVSDIAVYSRELENSRLSLEPGKAPDNLDIAEQGRSDEVEKRNTAPSLDQKKEFEPAPFRANPKGPVVTRAEQGKPFGRVIGWPEPKIPAQGSLSLASETIHQDVSERPTKMSASPGSDRPSAGEKVAGFHEEFNREGREVGLVHPSVQDILTRPKILVEQPKTEQKPGEILPVQFQEASLQGIIGDQWALYHNRSSPKWTINCLEVQIVNQTPAVQPQQPVRPQVQPLLSDAREALERYYVGHFIG
jgi:hypothetical protein